jgi:hypothetical protein
MKLYRLAVILGSLLFIPVSCTVSAIGAIPIISWLDARSVAQGDQVHHLFSVAAETRENKREIILLRLSELEKPRQAISFLLSQASGSFNTRTQWSYKVLEDHGSEQIIEVIEQAADGDYTIWSRYRASENKIIPISSRMVYFGYAFSAMFIGRGFSILVYIFGKILKHRIKKLEAETG